VSFGFRKLFKPDPSENNTLEWVMRQFWRISTSLEEIETQLVGGAQDHGDLTGLNDPGAAGDDHTNYLHKDITRNISVGYTTDIEADIFNVSLTPDFSLEYLKTMTVTDDFELNVPTGNGHGEYYLTIDSNGPYTLSTGTNVKLMDGNVTMLADGNYILNIHRYSATNAVAQLTLAEGSIATQGVTVENQGTPLATLATTIDFVGDGVVATGSGADKTITIESKYDLLTATDGGGDTLSDEYIVKVDVSGLTGSNTYTVSLPALSATTDKKIYYIKIIALSGAPSVSAIFSINPDDNDGVEDISGSGPTGILLGDGVNLDLTLATSVLGTSLNIQGDNDNGGWYII